MKRFNQKENRNKEKHTRGSITVFVALLLVPMIVVNGFLVDLSRMKLYGNQAAMTADNYGDAVLSVYSNLLKDLYGLFAVSESSEGEAALAELEKYITSSFNPQENWLKSGQHFTSVKEAGRDKSGFMPYQDAEVKVSYVGVEDYTLYNDMILANQIGDFMKYRIVQSVMNSGDTLLETVKEIKKSQDNGKVVSAKHEFDEAAKKVMEDMEEFYKLLKKLDTYPEYVGGYNTYAVDALEDIRNVISSTEYLIYYLYFTNKDKADAAFEKYDDDIDDEEEDIEDVEDSSLISIPEPDRSYFFYYISYRDTPDAHEDVIHDKLDQCLDDYKSYVSVTIPGYDGAFPARFNNFDELVDQLVSLAKDIKDGYKDLADARERLNASLNNDSITDAMRDGIKEEVALIDNILEAGGGVKGEYSADNFIGIADIFESNKAANPVFKDTVKKNYGDTKEMNYTKYLEDYVRELKECSFEVEEGDSSIGDYYLTNFALTGIKFKDNQGVIEKSTTQGDVVYILYKSKSRLNGLFKALEETFEGTGDKESANEQEDAANDTTESKQKELEQEDVVTPARDIPNITEYISAANGKVKSFKFTEMLSEAASLFGNSLSGAGNQMLLKFYMIQYGFGMFSNRMTGTAKPADDDNSASSSSSSSSSGGTSEKNTVKEYSLTGYELCRKINYAYQAELEYIFSGHLSSASNLNHVRNYILTFRAVMNYAATYSIDKINRPISDLAKAAAHINPLLGIAVSAALRTAVTAVETVADWQLLTQRKSVVVVKNELSDMSVDLSEIASVLGGDVGKSTEERSGVELTYEQYLTILLLLMTSTENVAMRIGDLIAINVSNVQSGLSEDAIMTDMSFNMKEAYTAVEAKCSVHLDFVIIPEHMAAMFMDEGTKGTWERNSKNTYSFTIIRAY